MSPIEKIRGEVAELRREHWTGNVGASCCMGLYTRVVKKCGGELPCPVKALAEDKLRLAEWAYGTMLEGAGCVLAEVAR